MSGSGLSYGLNFTKKPSGGKAAPSKRKPIFDDDDGSDDEDTKELGVETIGEFGGIPSRDGSNAPRKPNFISNSKKPESATKKTPISMYGDLSSTFTSKKHAETAEELDSSIYDYDGVYDSLKPKKKTTIEDQEKKPKYMSNLIAAAALRKRDATIAEEKKLAREREAEGDEFADKEKFVTSAYKKQQEENRRLEAEEKIREEAEQKKNKGAGMTNFYKNMLERGEQKHAEVMQAVDERSKTKSDDETVEEQKKSEADLAREINSLKEGAIAVNDEGQVVDKRQLLKGGLNIVPKPKSASLSGSSRGPVSARSQQDRGAAVGAGGGKQAMRERQSRMMEAQLEQATKRAFEEEEEERQQVERASKSRKTEGEIMGAKERYLARKREAEEAKKKQAG